MERLRFRECQNCIQWNGNISHCMNICMNPVYALMEFNKYKDLEEQGLLLRLPCEIGDGVYEVLCCGKDPSTGKPVYTIYEEGFVINLFYRIGQTVFLTREEAENKLKEMESE